MSRDFFHDAVVRALEKEGWVITDDPFSFEVGEVDFMIDLGAERVIAAEKDNEKIAVEIKSFIRQSPVSDFHVAIGQYENYLLALEEYDPSRKLFLAVPDTVFNGFFQRPFIQKVLNKKNILLILYAPDLQQIIKWIK